MNQAGSYLPQDRRGALAAGQDLSETTRGAALMADVSGFTPMSEAFAQEYGTHRGAEELTHRLNAFFGTLVSTVQRHGGSVLSFSGDAATCWFDGDDGLTAATCGVALQRVFAAFPPFRTDQGQTFAVRVKVSISEGEALRFIAGDPGIQLVDIMLGEPFLLLAAIDRQLKPGEVGLPRRLVRSPFPAHSQRGGEGSPDIAVFTAASPFPPLAAAEAPLPELGTELAKPWILPRVWDRLILGHVSFMADLRLAVVFFLKFDTVPVPGMTRIEQARALLTRFQQLLHAQGGSLLQVIIGDKGNYLYGSFGAPQAHENDPSRAMRALMEVRAVTNEALGLSDVKVGLSRGQIYAGTYGGVERKTFGVLGNEVNLAARLMDAAASGEIFVTAALERVSREEFDFTALGSRPIKGFHNPIPIFRLERMRTTSEIKRYREVPRSPLIGREADLALLQDALAVAASGGRVAALVEGEPGIGKTRLTDEVLSSARSRGFLVLSGEASLQEQATAFFAWRPVVRRAFGLEPYSSEDADEEVVVQHFAGGEAERLPLLNPVLAVKFPESDLSRQLVGENRLNSLIEFLATVLGSVAGDRPLLIVLDDVQWMDQASWRLLAGLVDLVPRTFFVLGSRLVPAGTEPDFDGFVARPGLTRVRLRPLEAPAVVALLKSHLKLHSLPDEVSSFVQLKAEGNPFFSLELTAALRDSGLLSIVDGVAALSDRFSGWKNLPFPDTLQGVVSSRIDGLDPVLQDLLKMASVFGMEFTLMGLQGIAHQTEAENEALEPRLAQAQALELVVEDLEASVEAYLFRHVVIQEVSYNRLLFQQKEDLHGRVAAWIEQQYSDNLLPYAGLLSYHWKAARQPDRAVPYLVQAGLEALKQFSSHEAIEVLLEALDLDRQGRVLSAELRGRSCLALGEAHLQNSDYPGAIRWFFEGLADLGSPVPRSPVTLAPRVLAELAVQRSHRRSGRLKAVADRDRATLVCQTLVTLVEVLATTNEPLLALYCTLRGTNLADRLGLNGERARAYSYCSVFLQFSGFSRPADGYARLAEDLLGQDLSPRETILPLLGLAFHAAGKGDFAKALDQFSTLGLAALTLGDHRRFRDSLQFTAIVRLLQGNWDEAARLLPEFHRLSSARNDLDNVLLADAHRLQLLLSSLGTIDPGLVASMLARVPAIITPAYIGPIVSVLALASQRLGKTTKSLELGEQALKELRKKPTKVFTFHLFFVSSVEFWFQNLKTQPGDRSVASKFRYALGELDQFRRIHPIGLPPFAFYCGHDLLTRRKVEEARHWFTLGLDFARKTGMVHESRRLTEALSQVPPRA